MSGDVMDELNASGELWPEPKTEDGVATTPPATPIGTPAPTGGELAAESATGVGAPEAAPSSHAARQEARLELVAEGNQLERQQVLGTCLPAADPIPTDLLNLVLAFQQIQERVITGPEKRVAAECIEAARRIYGGGQ